jgi:hypothetical protein
MKIIVDGEFVISDETGQKVTGRKGDVFYFPKGSRITFETGSFGVGFFVGQRMVSGCFSCPPRSLLVFRGRVGGMMGSEGGGRRLKRWEGRFSFFHWGSGTG